MNSSAVPGALGGRRCFVTTHWSVVLSAQGQDETQSVEALESLCRDYWLPLYGYARWLGQCPADAEDLVQGFFARLLEKDYLKSIVREKGRFRTFLLTAFKAYAANEWDRQHAKKRGGFASTLPIDQTFAESKYAAEAGANVSPDVAYERQWALAVLDQTLAQLKHEYVASGRARLFEHLQNYLAREESALSYADVARQLNLSEPAVKMAVHRLRARYRDLLREEIARTVSTPEEVDEELRHLFTLF